jgi:endonuclease YncB( thermonuclease family)
MKLARLARIAGWLALLILMALGAWLLDNWGQPPRIIEPRGQNIRVADGDSFAIGGQKMRLVGIDAPEYGQTCKNASGAAWQCGKMARASLELMIRQPDLSCMATAVDQYRRALVTCSTADVPDIASAQVLAGMAISNAYFGIRNYGEEEDIAHNAKRGIWIGEFVPPAEWRAAYPTLRTKTVPAE